MTKSDEPKAPAAESATVYYDGACPMCSAFSAAVQSSSLSEGLALSDFRKSELPPSISPQAAEGALQLVASDGTVLSGAEAVLTIFAKYRAGRVLKAALLFPLIRPLTDLGYDWVSKNRFHIFGVRRNLFATKLIVLLAFICGLMMTSSAWRGAESRSFPLAPLMPFLVTPRAPFDLVLFFVPIALAIWNFLSPRWRQLHLLVAGTIVVSLFDQNRWMPYTYQFMLLSLLLALSGLGHGPPAESEKQPIKRTEASIALVLASIWFWSGVLKFNWRFFQVGVGWLAAPTAKHLPESTQWILYLIIMMIPAAEALSAFALLFRRTRFLGALSLLGVHCGALLTLGPTGYGFNTSVWSWNVTMMAFLAIYFLRNIELDFSLLFKAGAARVLPILLFPTILPALNLANLWPHYLSFSLYTWAVTDGRILVANPADPGLPAEFRSLVRTDGARNHYVNVIDWSYLSINSPPYPSARVMRETLRGLCQHAHEPDSLALEITDLFDRLHPPPHVEVVRCRDL